MTLIYTYILIYTNIYTNIIYHTIIMIIKLYKNHNKNIYYTKNIDIKKE